MADCHPDKPHWARGFCGTCYQRWWNEQNPGKTKARRKANERPSECHPEKPELAGGLCGTCYRRKWRLEHPGAEWDRQNIANKRRYENQTEDQRRTRILRRYGITAQQYDALLQEQGGGCAVCSRLPEARPLQVDHDHATEAIRGLLCANCNSALGHAKDDIDRLRALIAYLEQHSA